MIKLIDRKLTACADVRPRAISRSGLSLTELLVSLGIIGLLLGLTLPAVMSARESARQAQCQNHLKQLGVATHNLYDARQRLPADLFPLRELLPYMGYTAEHNQIEAVHRDQPDTQFPSTPAAYFCPSDGWARPSDRVFNYHISAGSNLEQNDGFYLHPTVTFRTSAGNALTLKALEDGLSQTAMMSERLIVRRSLSVEPLSLEPGPDVRAAWWAPRTYQLGEEATLAADCSNPLVRQTAIQLGPYVPRIGTSMEQAYAHLLPPNGWTFQYQYSPFQNSLEVAAARPPTSEHLGGVNVLMADGSVRFVADSIDLDAWWAMGTVAGHESIR
jgi:prepilin-type processing-associated H-X9-DG protein